MTASKASANMAILVCSSLCAYVDAAQRKMQTSFPVITVDRKYHNEPNEMRLHLIAAMENLPSDTDTILVAMGFCGGSWENTIPTRRIVIPRVDDCITLLLHTDNRWSSNLKQPGHLYLRDTDTAEYSLEAMQRKLCLKYGGINGTMAFHSMFAEYTNVDMIDTGIYDCYSEEYVSEAQRNADLIGAALDYVAGSNLLLEKLVSGRWDHQFAVIEAGQTISRQILLPDN